MHEPDAHRMSTRRLRALAPIIGCLAAFALSCVFSTAAVPGETIDTVVFTVDGMPVLRSELMEMIGKKDPQDIKKKDWDDACAKLAEQKLIARIAKGEAIEVTDEEVDKRLDERLQEAGATREQYKQELPRIRRQIREYLIRATVVNKKMERNVVVTAAEVKDFYEKNPEQFRVEEQRHVRMISMLLDKTAADQEAARKAAREKIDAVAQQVKEGKDFVSLAKTESNDPYAEKGGDWGRVKKGVLLDVLDKAAFSLEVGKVSDVVESPQGFHILRVDERQLEYQQAFADVEEKLRRKLYEELYEKKVKEYLDGLVENAMIEKFDEGPAQ